MLNPSPEGYARDSTVTSDIINNVIYGEESHLIMKFGQF